MKTGLNLYSLRHQVDTEEKLLQTAHALREMGYSSLQFSGDKHGPDTIRRTISETGLPVVLTHVPMDRIINDTDALMEEHACFGCYNIGLGGMDPRITADRDRCYSTLEQLERAGERMAEKGFSFFYHHHHFEFLKHDGETVFDYIIRTAPHINFTLDTYWLQYGGVDVCQTIERLRGRIRCVHLKDYRIEAKWDEKGNVKLEPVFAPIGDGTMDFAAILPKAREAGAEHFLVEQDNASDMKDPFAQVERSIRYLNTHF